MLHFLSSSGNKATSNFSMNPKMNVAKQAYYFEKEKNNDCISCGENITHPLCPNCLAKAFHKWLKNFPREDDPIFETTRKKDKKTIKSKLRNFMKHHNSNKDNSVKCVACHNSVHVCPKCFTEHLYNLIKEAGIGTKALTEFLFIFNFDFEHNGYSQELEAYGGY